VDYLKEVISKAGLGSALPSVPVLPSPSETPSEWKNAEPLANDYDEDPEEQDYEERQPEILSIKTLSMDLIEKVLRKHGGSRKAAAAELGISERTLYRKLKQMN
jgi:transcriptional regulator with PAS, ATPase and Fis domain